MKSRPVFHRGHRARLHLERLESRETPAGVVTLSLFNNTFIFIGDGNASGNEVRVTAIAGNHFLIEGLNGTTFNVLGKGNVGSTIDTSLITGFTFPNNGTTKILSKFLGGPDRFEYDGFSKGHVARQFADIALDMGAGSDTVLATQFVAKSLTIKSAAPASGSDDDTITLAAGGVHDLDPGIVGPETYGGGIKTHLTIVGATGNDSITLAASVGGNVTVSAADGNDALIIGGSSRIGGNLAFAGTATKVLANNIFSIDENSLIAKNVTFANPGNSASATVQNSRIGGNLKLDSGSGVAGSAFSLSGLNVGGNVDIKDGALANSLTMNGVNVAKNLTLVLGDGGTTGTHSLQGVAVNGNLTATYGKGNDSFDLQFSTIFGNATITNSDGVDRLRVDGSTIGKSLAYTGGAGGNQGAGNPDAVTTTTIGGMLKITYGAGNENLDINNSTVHGAVAVKTGDGVNRLDMAFNNFFANSAFTGGLGNDTLMVNHSNFFGATNLTTSGGNDTISLLGSGQYHGKMTINTGGAGPDDDTLTIEAALSNDEHVFLGGVSIITGAGADSTTAGTQSGKVVILNNLVYPDEANLSDTVNFGSNLIRL